VVKTDAEDYKEAYRLIQKSSQYFNHYLEFIEKYSVEYKTLAEFKDKVEAEDPDFPESLKKQVFHLQAHLEFRSAKKFYN
jgi:hypothetical protein